MTGYWTLLPRQVFTYPRRWHDGPAAHREGVQVPGSLGLAQQRAHELHCRRIEGRRQPLVVRIGPVPPASRRQPHQLPALRHSSDLVMITLKAKALVKDLNPIRGR